MNPQAQTGPSGGGGCLSVVILAAGLSRRFGRDKLVQPLAGRALGRRVIEAALASRVDQVIVVARAGNRVALTEGLTGFDLVINPYPETGQADSMKLGLGRVREAADHVLFLLADQPLVSAELINRFRRAARDGASLAALAGPDGPTPPTLFARKYFPDLLLTRGDQGGRAVLAARREEVRLIEPIIADQGRDVDRPADLAGLDRDLGFGQD